MNHGELLQTAVTHHQPQKRLRRTPPNPGTEVLCKYMLANMQQRITLQKMQQISDMSPRALQYAFMLRFGCSPMQWLRNIRLDWARRELETQGQVRCIAELAKACGIPKPSDFAMHYRRRFGEVPSETLSRSLELALDENFSIR